MTTKSEEKMFVSIAWGVVIFIIGSIFGVLIAGAFGI